MPTINSDAEMLDREAGCSPHWSRSDSGSEPKSFVYPSQTMPERRQGSPRPAGNRPPAIEQIAGEVDEMPCVTPRQWLSQWCCLDAQV
ncbi:MAG: hypothetical protein NDI91_14210 [Sulfuritalea sp.]|nr:hypothetical protein [Sulfuritalea sp.]